MSPIYTLGEIVTALSQHKSPNSNQGEIALKKLLLFLLLVLVGCQRAGNQATAYPTLNPNVDRYPQAIQIVELELQVFGGTLINVPCPEGSRVEMKSPTLFWVSSDFQAQTVSILTSDVGDNSPTEFHDGDTVTTWACGTQAEVGFLELHFNNEGVEVFLYQLQEPIILQQDLALAPPTPIPPTATPQFELHTVVSWNDCRDSNADTQCMQVASVDGSAIQGTCRVLLYLYWYRDEVIGWENDCSTIIGEGHIEFKLSEFTPPDGRFWAQEVYLQIRREGGWENATQIALPELVIRPE